MTGSPKDVGGLSEEVRKLEAEARVAELTAQKVESRLRTLEAEDKIRELQLRRVEQKKGSQSKK